MPLPNIGTARDSTSLRTAIFSPQDFSLTNSPHDFPINWANYLRQKYDNPNELNEKDEG
ncbi:hypothetical protein H6H02_13225 [Coleofasciculus sp. FACHB-1120]|nr:hypothetical protein [Coleofasciculus sp. FACHB-1120]